MSKLPVPRWEMGTLLYLRANPESVGMVTGYLYRPGPVLLYVMGWTDREDDRWEQELTEEKTFAVNSGGES